MKKRNYYLAIGSVLSIAFLIPIFLPGLMDMARPGFMGDIMAFTETGYIALAIGGMRTAGLAALLVASIRLAMAQSAGLAAGLGSWSCGKLISLFEYALKILPPSLVALAVLAGVFTRDGFDSGHFWVFIAVLSLLGWSGPAKKIADGMEGLQEDGLSVGRKAAGEGPLSIAIGNWSRLFKDELPAMFFEQVSRVLYLIAQLCVFFALLEGTPIGEKAVMAFAKEGSEKLSGLAPYLMDNPLMILYAGIAFFTGIFGFNLMAEGMRKRKEGDATASEDEAGYPATAAAVCAACVLAVLFAYLNVPISEFSMGEMHRRLDFERTGQLIAGSPQAGERADLIAAELEGMGYSRVEGSFKRSYERSSTYVPVYEELVSHEGDKRTLHIPGESYFADTFGRFDVSAKVYDGRENDYYALEERRGDLLGKWILLERRSYSDEEMMKFAERFVSEFGAEGVLLVQESGGRRYAAQGKEMSSYPVLTVKKDLADKLADSTGGLSYRQISKSSGREGLYVLAELEGVKQERQEIVIVALSYAWQYESIKSGKIEFGLELARRLAGMREELGKTIVLAFFDSAARADMEAQDSFANDLPFDAEDVCLYVDLTGIAEKSSGGVFYERHSGSDGSLCPAAFDRAFRSALERKGYMATYGRVQASDSAYGARGLERVSIAFEPRSKSLMDIEDFGGVMIEAISGLVR